MGVQVTGETVGITARELLLVGCRVTLGTFRYVTMLQVMTGGAVDLTVPAGSFLPFGINLTVTGTAGNRRGVFRVGNLKRFMHLMAGAAGANNLSSTVRFRMAGTTGRLVTMCGMTGLTGELGMLAGERDELLFG